MNSPGQCFSVVVDREGRLLSASRRWRELFGEWWTWPMGAPPDEVVVHPASQTPWRTWCGMLERVLRSGGEVEKCLRWSGPDGRRFRVKLAVKAITDAGGHRVVGAAAEGSARPADVGRRPRRVARGVIRGTAAPWRRESTAWIRLRPAGRAYLVEAASPAAVRLWPDAAGLTAGSPLLGARNGEPWRRLRAALSEAKRGGLPVATTLVFPAPAQAWRRPTVIHATLTPVARRRIVLVLRDETTLRDSLQSVADYSQRVESLVEHGVWLLALSPAGRIVEMPCESRRSGPVFVTGRRLSEYLAAEHRDDLVRAVGLASESAQTVAFEWRLAGQTERWFRTRLVASTGLFARPGLLAMVVEITGDRLAERTRRRLATLVEQSPDGIVGLSPAGVITDWNGGAESITGIPAAEALGRPVFELISPEQRDAERKVLRTVLAGESIKAAESRYIRPDGRTVDLVIATFPHGDDDGEARGVTHVFRDISRLRSMEEQLHRAQRTVAQGMLAAMIGHEIRNYLGVTCGLAELFQESHPEHRAEVAPMLRAAKIAVEVSRRLQRLSQPAPLQVAVCDLGQLVRDAYAMLAPMIARDLRVEISGKKALLVRIDPVAFDQVLVNLVLNARDAVSEVTGLIVVRLRPQRRRDGARIGVVEVCDNGPGIPEQIKGRLFERYFTTKPNGRGTGLGLANARRLVHFFGGDIALRSREGRGTTVRIELPVVPGASG